MVGENGIRAESLQDGGEESLRPMKRLVVVRSGIWIVEVRVNGWQEVPRERMRGGDVELPGMEWGIPVVEDA